MTLGLALSGPFLEWSGFHIDLGANQPVEVMTRMRLGFSIAPTLLLFVAGAILFFYDLGPARMAEIRVELERRRGAF